MNGEIAFFVQTPGDTEVGDRQAVICPEHHIAGLQVAMNNAARVNGGKTERNSLEIAQRVLRSLWALQTLLEITTRKELHGDVAVISGQTVVVDPDHLSAGHS